MKLACREGVALAREPSRPYPILNLHGIELGPTLNFCFRWLAKLSGIINVQGCKKENPNNTQGKTKYIGVSQNGNNWAAVIRKKNIAYHLGTFQTQKEAALAYNEKAVELYGSSKKLNIIIN